MSTPVRYQNVHAMLEEITARYANLEAYRWFADARTLRSATWAQFLEQVHAAAKSLIALGVEKDDQVSILSANCCSWLVTDFAVATVGACSAPIYPSLPARDCGHIVQHSDAVLVFAENEAQLQKLQRIRADIPDVRTVVLFNGSGPRDGWVMSFEEFLGLGSSISDAELRQRVSTVHPDDVAFILYTAGTTGVSKGALLTHRNVTFAAQSASECLDGRKGDETLLFLPLAHALARIGVYCSALFGTTTTFARDITTFAEDVRTVRPHHFVTVPRVLEQVLAKVQADVSAKGLPAQQLFRWACRVGGEVSDRRMARQPVTGRLALRQLIADRFVFHKLREALGGRLRWIVSGGAPISPQLCRFFNGAGIPILEGLGMTENAALSNLNRMDSYRFGWVGPPAPGVEQKLAEDGEVLVRGPNVMKGYYKDPDATAHAISPDGWLRTGDLGEIDAHEFLRITARRKELIVTAAGKHVAPSRVEGLLTQSRYIRQACLLGNWRRYCVALVTLDPEAVEEHARERGISHRDMATLRENPRIIELIAGEVEKVNEQLAFHESVKRFALVDEFTVESGMLTPTLNVKRAAVEAHYRDQIEAMYAEAAPRAAG